MFFNDVDLHYDMIQDQDALMWSNSTILWCFTNINIQLKSVKYMLQSWLK